MKMDIPETWRAALPNEGSAPYFQILEQFLARERREHEVFPPENQVFASLEQTAPADVKVVLLGQDPYHDAGQAHGLSFSVPVGIKPPPSLVNIFKELEQDLGYPAPTHGCLESWARQGVLLLNTVLTVRSHRPYSHRKQGWEQFTDAILSYLDRRPEPVVFLLWGRPAQAKKALLRSGHSVLEAAHPSPLSARTGFFGSKPFSRANAALEALGTSPIAWQLPSAPSDGTRSE